MSDQNNDHSLAGEGEDHAAGSLPAAFSRAETTALNKVLTLEAVLTSARLREKIATVCLRSDLDAELTAVLVELSGLVDPEGNVVGNDEAALGDSKATRAASLSGRAQELRDEMAEHTFDVRFRSMSDDDFTVFEKANRGNDGKVKDLVDFNNKLIAATAIAPKMTVDEVKQLRAHLSAKQMTELADTAWKVCTEGGLDVPKLPRFSLSQKPGE